jgi:hypothetical protein
MRDPRNLPHTTLLAIATNNEQCTTNEQLPQHDNASGVLRVAQKAGSNCRNTAITQPAPCPIPLTINDYRNAKQAMLPNCYPDCSKIALTGVFCVTCQPFEMPPFRISLVPYR